LPLWLLMVFIVLEEVAMADLFRTIAMDVLDVRTTEVDVVDSKLAGEEDKMTVLLLVMMLPLLTPTVLLLMSMVLLQMTHMVPLLKAQLTMIMRRQVVPLLMMHMVPQLKNMEPQLMLMVLLLKSMVLLLMTLMVPLLKVQLLVMTTMMTMLRSLLMLMLLLKPLHQLMRKQDVDVLVEDLAALAGLQQPKRAVLDVPELLARDPLLPERHLDVVSRQIGLHLLLGGSKSKGVDVD